MGIREVAVLIELLIDRVLYLLAVRLLTVQQEKFGYWRRANRSGVWLSSNF